MDTKLEFANTTTRGAKRSKKVIRRRSNLNGHAVPVCDRGKLRYRSREQAQDALTAARHARATALGLGRDTNRREQRAYECFTCGGWHLTSSACPTGVGA